MNIWSWQHLTNIRDKYQEWKKGQMQHLEKEKSLWNRIQLGFTLWVHHNKNQAIALLRALTFDENLPQSFRIAPVCLCWEMRFEKTVEFYSVGGTRCRQWWWRWLLSFVWWSSWSWWWWWWWLWTDLSSIGKHFIPLFKTGHNFSLPCMIMIPIENWKGQM